MRLLRGSGVASDGAGSWLATFVPEHGGYTELPFSTGFHTVEVSPQRGIPRGGALTFECWETPNSNSQRLVVERIELVPDENMGASSP